MVRAILDERKTQTRRVLKQQPLTVGEQFGLRQGARDDELPYQPADRLWVRETWMPAIDAGGSDWRYRADYDDDGEYMGSLQRWRPSIHMPRLASRLTLTVIGVIVERLQEISEKDALAEGTQAISMADVKRQAAWCERQDFSRLWDKINGKRPGCRWEDNPWVVVVAFTHRLGNIDDPKAA